MENVMQRVHKIFAKRFKPGFHPFIIYSLRKMKYVEYSRTSFPSWNDPFGTVSLLILFFMKREM